MRMAFADAREKLLLVLLFPIYQQSFLFCQLHDV